MKIQIQGKADGLRAAINENIIIDGPKMDNDFMVKEKSRLLQSSSHTQTIVRFIGGLYHISIIYIQGKKGNFTIAIRTLKRT